MTNWPGNLSRLFYYYYWKNIVAKLRKNIVAGYNNIEENYNQLEEIKRKDNLNKNQMEDHYFSQAIKEFIDYRKSLEKRLELNRSEQQLKIRELVDEIKKYPRRIKEHNKRN